MLRYVLRRAFWVLPSLILVSLLGFWGLSHLPQAPNEDEAELPLFVNTHPRDIRVHVDAALSGLAKEAGTVPHQVAATQLEKLGGAALPFVLPRLEGLAPKLRTKVLEALAPVAARMRLRHFKRAASTKSALLFWTLFWQTHDVEFRRSTADSAVSRYARYGTEPRAQQVRELDTFALDSIFRFFTQQGAELQPAESQRLLAMVVGIVGQDVAAKVCTNRVRDGCVGRWLHWWRIKRWQYVVMSGTDKLLATATSTRYGLWVLDTMASELDGDPRTGQARLFAERGLFTMGLVLAALVLSALLAVVLAMFLALRAGLWSDRLIQLLLLGLHVSSPVFLGWLMLGRVSDNGSRFVGAVLVLALGTLLQPTRQMQLGLMREFRTERWAAVRARGWTRVGAMWHHAIRQAALPVLSRGFLQLPWNLCAAFVLEQMLSLPGLAEPTLRAVRSGDVSWLMMLASSGALLALMTHASSDAVQGWLDPRLREALTRTRRNAT